MSSNESQKQNLLVSETKTHTRNKYIGKYFQRSSGVSSKKSYHMILRRQAVSRIVFFVYTHFDGFCLKYDKVWIDIVFYKRGGISFCRVELSVSRDQWIHSHHFLKECCWFGNSHTHFTYIKNVSWILIRGFWVGYMKKIQLKFD